MEVYADMLKQPEELQRRWAPFIRDCWIQLGKWEGKQSKKQTAKIQTLKKLLD